MFASHKECLEINSEMIIGSSFIAACREGAILSHWLRASSHRVFSEQYLPASHTRGPCGTLPSYLCCQIFTFLPFIMCFSSGLSSFLCILASAVPSTSCARFRRAHNFPLSFSFLNVEYVSLKSLSAL